MWVCGGWGWDDGWRRWRVVIITDQSTQPPTTTNTNNNTITNSWRTTTSGCGGRPRRPAPSTCRPSPRSVRDCVLGCVFVWWAVIGTSVGGGPRLSLTYNAVLIHAYSTTMTITSTTGGLRHADPGYQRRLAQGTLRLRCLPPSYACIHTFENQRHTTHHQPHHTSDRFHNASPNLCVYVEPQ